MTIATCFEFDGGILFCADTKITREVKTTQTKIFDRVYDGNYSATVFVLVGPVPCGRKILGHVVLLLQQAFQQNEATANGLSSVARERG